MQESDKAREDKRGRDSGHTIHNIIEKLKSSADNVLTVQLSKEGIKYFIGSEPISKDYVELLRERGIVVESEYVSVLSCPNCGDYVLSVLPTCPRCKSSDVLLVELYAHIKCGYIGLSSEFEKDNKKVCPNCGEEISDPSELKSYGKIFRCLNCGARFDMPVFRLRCLNCGLMFSIKDSRILRIPQYRLNKEALSKVEDIVVQDYITSVVEEVVREYFNKYVIERSVEVTGMSGVKHVIPVRVRTSQGSIYIYPILREQDVYSLVSMLLDVNLDSPIIVLCLEEAARKASLSCPALGSGKSNVKVLMLKNIEELRSKLQNLLREISERS